MDYNRDLKKVESGDKTLDEALEALRKQIVPTMRNGKHFVINVDK